MTPTKIKSKFKALRWTLRNDISIGIGRLRGKIYNLICKPIYWFVDVKYKRYAGWHVPVYRNRFTGKLVSRWW